jgi:hypothetical protein
MITALIISMLFGGGSTAMLGYIANAQDSVKIVMVKDERRKQALSTLKTMKKRTNARNKEVRRATKNLNKALDQDNISASDIDAIWGEYFAEIDQYDNDMLDLRFELKDHISREEWKEIFPVPEKKT